MPGLENRKAAGLNEHLRFLRYGKGHFFGPHQDGENRTALGFSVYSALLYLSEAEGGPKGGTTRFLAPQCPQVAQTGRCDWSCDLCLDAVCSRGDLLIFKQTLLHAGTEPLGKEKFVMRTDVMYPKG
ncbi:unnamed protein product [Effrenium voratum]|nr:unnamed protein product [Effrenium voratum]